MPDQDHLTLYSLHGCPYCAIVRLRLGELGLSYSLREQPASRRRRTEVIAVSGQPTVPVLVVARPGQADEVLADENAILAYLDRRYAARELAAAEEPWGEADGRALQAAVDILHDLGQQLEELAQGASTADEVDRANILRAAAGHVALAGRWARGQLEDL